MDHAFGLGAEFGFDPASGTDMTAAVRRDSVSGDILAAADSISIMFSDLRLQRFG
jgi:hypothetical protein